MTKRVAVVGAGLAGCEAAWQLAARGIPVALYEMKPKRFSPAHSLPTFAELVCSNSLKATQLTNASGLLKAEMDKLGSLTLRLARAASVPAGGALAVNRALFSRAVTDALEANPLIKVVREVVERLPEPPAIIATGPLTDAFLAADIAEKTGRASLHFFDAVAPIVGADSIDETIAFRASRYGRGDDYLNLPMNEAEYDAFFAALTSAELAPLHDFEASHVFEGCLAVEILAARGRMTLAFGPLKPVGLIDPRTGKMPFAVVQLRRENLAGTAYGLVGFQTRLKFSEQRRVFSMIPGLRDAEFLRYGVMHRNTYLQGPTLLSENYALKGEPLLRFAGQLSGVEGYMESAASGLIVGRALARRLLGEAETVFPETTVVGALAKYVCTPNGDFQPMNANFGLLPQLPGRVRNKKQRYEALSARALAVLDGLLAREGE
jgi:methylenetetrahydrofolate--tRNA-(uracil-5-)-methyltransferase